MPRTLWQQRPAASVSPTSMNTPLRVERESYSDRAAGEAAAPSPMASDGMPGGESSGEAIGGGGSNGGGGDGDGDGDSELCAAVAEAASPTKSSSSPVPLDSSVGAAGVGLVGCDSAGGGKSGGGRGRIHPAACGEDGHGRANTNVDGAGRAVGG